MGQVEFQTSVFAMRTSDPLLLVVVMALGTTAFDCVLTLAEFPAVVNNAVCALRLDRLTFCLFG
jgi:hypothetical protein